MELRGKGRRKLTMLYLLGWLWVPFAAAGSPALPHENCRSKVYNRADATLIRARADWPSLYKHRQAYPACDDGALAEGYSDAVAKLLAYRWDRLDELNHLATRHPAFGRWVIRHIDESAAQDDLGRIVKNSTNCRHAATSRKLCVAVQQAAKRALSR